MKTTYIPKSYSVFNGLDIKLIPKSHIKQARPFVREAANKKKVFFLVVFFTPPLGLSGHRNFFVML